MWSSSKYAARSEEPAIVFPDGVFFPYSFEKFGKT